MTIMWFGFIGLFIGQLFGAGILPVFLKLGVKEVSPLLFSSLRFIIATVGILIIFLPKKKFSLGIPLKLVKRSLLFAANIALFSLGIQFTTATMSQTIIVSVPVTVAILAHFMLNEKITREKIVGFFIALSGLSFLILQSITKTEHLTFGTPFGNMLILIASVCWSLYLVLSRAVSREYSSIKITYANFIFTALALLLLSPFEALIKPTRIENITTVGIISLIILGLGTVIMYVCIQYGIKKTSATTVALFQYLSPFFAALFAVPTLHEKPTISLAIGGLLILVGVFYSTTFQRVKKSLSAVLQ